MAADNDSYIAAVVEFAALAEPRPANMEFNLQSYLQFILDAKSEGADIIVFAEDGLAGAEDPLESMAVVVPDPKDEISPCDLHIFSHTITTLSCAAQNSSIYVVVNLLEKYSCGNRKNCSKKGWFMYNTNVVFDRLGRVIARYRKSHLFAEFDVLPADRPELSIFETDFGVRFGTVICFDILFEKPTLQLVREAGVTDIAFTHAWFSMLPYLSALQFHSGWSYAEDVNLLSAGYNDPVRGSSGSGIHLGRLGTANFTMSNKHVSRLVTATVLKKPRRAKQDTHGFVDPENVQNKTAGSALASDSSALSIRASEGNLFFRQENVKAFTSTLLDDTHHAGTLCHEDLCCKFRVTYHSYMPSSSYRFRAVVFRGVESLLNFATAGIQSCGIVACADTSPESCGVQTVGKYLFKEIIIKGEFDAHRATVVPSTVTGNYASLPSDSFEFDKVCSETKCNVTLQLLKPIDNLLTFGVHGRLFSMDGFEASQIKNNF